MIGASVFRHLSYSLCLTSDIIVIVPVFIAPLVDGGVHLGSDRIHAHRQHNIII